MADLKTPTIHGKMTVKVLDTSTDANYLVIDETTTVSYTHLRAHET